MKINPKIIGIVLLLTSVAIPVASIYFFTGNVRFTLSILILIGVFTLGGLGKAFESGFNATTLLNTFNDIWKKRKHEDCDDKET